MQDKKKKKNIKVRDLKPSKDAKGGGHVASGHGIAGPRPTGGTGTAGATGNK